MAGKLGCNIPVIDPSKQLMALDYVRRLADGTLPPVKPSGGRVNLVPAGKWYILLNDQVGDCVIAGIFHQILVNYVMNTGKIPPWTEAQITACVKQMYMKITGWDGKVPPDSTDQGTDPIAAYNFWQNTGMLLPDGTRDKIEFYLVVNLQDTQGATTLDDKTWEEIEWLLEYFSGGGFCFSVSEEAMRQFDADENWTIDSASATSPIEGGHYVYQVEQVDGSDEQCITWAKAQQMARDFMRYYGSLLLFPISKKMLNAAGKTPEGLDWAAIVTDSNIIKNGGVTPAPVVIASITVTPASATVAMGQTLRLKAVATLSDGTTQDVTASCNWQSADEDMATVSAGMVTGIAVGPVKIMAMSGTVGGSAAIVVTPSPNNQGCVWGVGKLAASFFGQQVTQDVAPALTKGSDGNGHLMVELTPLIKALGGSVAWDAATQTATVSGLSASK